MLKDGNKTPPAPPADQSGSGNDAGITPTGDGNQSNSDTPPGWFTEYTEKQDARFKDVFRHLGKMKDPNDGAKPSGDDTGKSNGATHDAPPSASPEDLDAVRQLGRIEATLTDDALTDLDDMRKDGAGYGELLRTAKLLAKHGAKPSADQDAKSPTGEAGTASATDGAAYPTTYTELRELKEKDPARFKEVMADPGFDHNKLSS